MSWKRISLMFHKILARWLNYPNSDNINYNIWNLFYINGDFLSALPQDISVLQWPHLIKSSLFLSLMKHYKFLPKSSQKRNRITEIWYLTSLFVICFSQMIFKKYFGYSCLLSTVVYFLRALSDNKVSLCFVFILYVIYYIYRSGFVSTNT